MTGKQPEDIEMETPLAQQQLTGIQENKNEMKSMMDTLLKEIKAMKETLQAIPQLTSKVRALEAENISLRKELAQVNLHTCLLDQHSKAGNLVFYGFPGQAGESRNTSEDMVNKVFSKLGVKQRFVMAHRLGMRENSPILVQFPCKPDAQEVFMKVRKARDTSLRGMSLGDSGKIEVRYHLSTFLGNLLRAATLVKKEANWAFCRPFTSGQSVEMVKSRGQYA